MQKSERGLGQGGVDHMVGCFPEISRKAENCLFVVMPGRRKELTHIKPLILLHPQLLPLLLQFRHSWNHIPSSSHLPKRKNKVFLHLKTTILTQHAFIVHLLLIQVFHHQGVRLLCKSKDLFQCHSCFSSHWTSINLTRLANSFTLIKPIDYSSKQRC